MDELACLRTNPETDAEKHFVKVCLGHEEPQTIRERLWLRELTVVRYKASLKRVAACGKAIRPCAAEAQIAIRELWKMSSKWALTVTATTDLP